MKKMLLVIGVVMVAGCGPSHPKDSVKSLVAHPARLREVERQCSDNYAKMGTVECDAASEARHRLFMGNGPRYAPSKEQPTF